ncbi:class I SAM-dependent methyltransferase [Streptomyces coacervatus]|nr:class I SAM-dependent methyltransferase [Streptomyces coacervatus]MDF2263852.1 class I SAM-dependent methyltransferase [Streptomyces coacervatus]
MHPLVNTEQAEAWNGYEGHHWADHADRWDAAVGGVNNPLLAAAALSEDQQVLDIGCGTGQTTRLAARRARRAMGIDLSAPMLARARATATEQGIGNVQFQQGDAQIHPFDEAAYDVAISRGAIMFFADPVAAFTNILRALRPGGRLAFVCPQDMHRNDWFTAPVTALLGHPPTPSDPDDAPGMFSLADPPRIHHVLSQAGFHDVTTTPVTVPMIYGRDAADAATFFLSSGPVRHQLHGADRTTVNQALDAVTTALRPYEHPDGVRFSAAWWLATATCP